MRATAGSHRSVRALRGSFTSALAAAFVAGASLLACGSGGGGGSVILPPGGVGVGNLACTAVIQGGGNAFVQGSILTVVFTLTDVNINIAAADQPISFEVIGGAIPDPPDRTNAAGQAIITFVSDPTFFGEARVALIQPTQRLRCDVAFTMRKPACVLTAEIRAANGITVIDAFDACNPMEPPEILERHVVRRVYYRVTRLNPVSGMVEPLAGAFLHLQGEGMNFGSLVVGPTNAMGIIEAGDTDGDGDVDEAIAPFESGARIATLSASVIIPDANMDGFEDAFACNACSVSWDIIDPVCDAPESPHGSMVAPMYRTAAGGASMAPLRPGESATVSGRFAVDGVALVGFPVIASTTNGTINGSGVPVTVLTDGMGRVTVTYRPNVGFAGTDTVTLQADDDNTTCAMTAPVVVVTCGLTAGFSVPPTSGAPTTATLTIVGVAAATALGETVSLDAIGGGITPQPPTRTVVDLGGGAVGVMTTFTPSLGFSGTGRLSISFISGYDCVTTSASFVISP